MPWQSIVKTTSAPYSGTSGHTYAFNVRATDGAGNVEAQRSVADASIAVNGAFADPSVGTGGGGGCTIGGAAQRDASLPLLVLVASILVFIGRRREGPKPRRAAD